MKCRVQFMAEEGESSHIDGTETSSTESWSSWWPEEPVCFHYCRTRSPSARNECSHRLSSASGWPRRPSPRAHTSRRSLPANEKITLHLHQTEGEWVSERRGGRGEVGEGWGRWGKRCPLLPCLYFWAFQSFIFILESGLGFGRSVVDFFFQILSFMFFF